MPQPQQQRQICIAMSATYTTPHSNARSLTHWVRPGIEPASSCLWVYFCKYVHWCHFFRFHMYMISEAIFLSCGLVQSSLGSSLLLQMAWFCSSFYGWVVQFLTYFWNTEPYVRIHIAKPYYFLIILTRAELMFPFKLPMMKRKCLTRKCVGKMTQRRYQSPQESFKAIFVSILYKSSVYEKQVILVCSPTEGWLSWQCFVSG